MSEESVQKIYKLLLVGDAAVGKSCLQKRYTADTFQSNHGPTIGSCLVIVPGEKLVCSGVDFTIKFYRVKGERIKLMIWDTAGLERFQSLIRRYYDEAHGVLFVYDVTRPSSLESLERTWIPEVVENNSFRNAVNMIVGNKIDKEAREVARADGEAVAARQGCLFAETSAMTGVGVEEAFAELVKNIQQTPELVQDGLRQAGHGLKPAKPPRPQSRQCWSAYGLVFDRFLNLIWARSK